MKASSLEPVNSNLRQACTTLRLALLQKHTLKQNSGDHEGAKSIPCCRQGNRDQRPHIQARRLRHEVTLSVYAAGRHLTEPPRDGPVHVASGCLRVRAPYSPLCGLQSSCIMTVQLASAGSVPVIGCRARRKTSRGSCAGLATILLAHRDQGGRSCTATTTPGHPFEPASQQAPPRVPSSESRVKRGNRIVGIDTELVEKLGRNDLCPCGSGRRFPPLLPANRPFRWRTSRLLRPGPVRAVRFVRRASTDAPANALPCRCERDEISRDVRQG